MANDTLQFVDSIAATPTVRLDVNDGTKWECEVDSLDFAPPPLRRAINGTLLTDGSVQSASAYDNRVIRCTFSLVDTTIDNVATQIQLLNRELDREFNYLKWQPSGATSPVFFRTLRSPVINVAEVASRAMTSFDVEILAEPFALGLREDVAVGTVNNDPAAGSNGLFFDVTGVKGDVAAPMVMKDSGGANGLASFGILACRNAGTPSDLVFFKQAESLTLGTDTTNPGAGPDAAMSGATLNNFVRTSFATATNSQRLRWDLTALTAAQRKALHGTYRVFVCVRRSGAVAVLKAQVVLANSGGITVSNSKVTLPSVTSRILVDFGLITLGLPSYLPGRFASQPAFSSNANNPSGAFLDLYAQRDSGTDTLDWDYIALVPADTQYLTWAFNNPPSTDLVIDGGAEQVLTDDAAGANIFDGSSGLFAPYQLAVAGGFPLLVPNQTSRFIYLRAQNGTTVFPHDKTATGTVNVSYWPRYLYVRPATT